MRFTFITLAIIITGALTVYMVGGIGGILLSTWGIIHYLLAR